MYDYKIKKIDENTYCLQEYAKTYSYLLMGSKKALLIDTGCGCGNLYQTVKSITDLEVVVVNSHGHLDHVGANYQFPSVWLAKEDEALMWKSSSKEVKEKEISRYLQAINPEFDQQELKRIIMEPQVNKIEHLQNKMLFELGNRTIEAIATPGHTEGSYCFLDIKNKQLYTADTICDISILLFFKESMSVEIFHNSIKSLYKRKEEFNILYPGHHTVPLNKQYIDEYLICSEKIMNGTLKGYVHEEEIGTGRKATYERVGIVYKEDAIFNDK